MSKVYDTVIIGSGPAGLSAGIYAARAELDFVILEDVGEKGGQIVNTPEIDNYPGLYHCSGFDLSAKFREHAESVGAAFTSGRVSGIEKNDDIFGIRTEEGETILSKTVILATGAKAGALNVPGEEDLVGCGVSYCATCDGAFFRNRTVAVVGGGDVAAGDAILLSRICRKVFLIHRRDSLRAAKVLQSRLFSTENIEVLWNTSVNSIVGDDQVEALDITDKQTGEQRSLPVQGVFVAVGNLPATSFVRDFVACDKSGYVIADETTKTSVPGFFAAGDCRTKSLRQVITAAADGATAVLAVDEYLRSC